MKPIILINCNVTEPPMNYVQRAAYVERVTEAGGLPLLVPPLSAEEDIIHALSVAGGVILAGSDDIDPSIYGRKRHEKTKFMHRRREKFDLKLSRIAYERDIPLLAICGGFQALAVALGGTLLQHIPDSVPNSLNHFVREPGDPHHDVEIDRESILFSIVGESPLETNSHHHQALKQVPGCLKVTAHTADGVIEAYEDSKKKFCIGVQWHPERMPGRKPHEALFEALLVRSAEQASSRTGEQEK